ncbi:phosphatidylinositol 4-phosphate 5-kinase 10 [Gossypium raimondii]|uniref:phosphatidylinositol 4-phosphate 5-kinase 10 n=1 Tax=Gossypium raimondii TaxID=29730 RepID=UPI00063B0142|nr:phosphatidylinositol 4-phosphate 5-kinase 10 [Gossypium raimondii]
MAFSDKELMTTDYMIQCSRHHCNNLPPGIVTGFEWKDYCPKSFRLIQELENIDNDDYMMVVCSDETIKQVTSTVRPGNMFLFSNDSRFAIKTLRKSELKVLLEMLPSYYSHIKRFRSTILNKLYGAHVVKPAGGTKVYFVVVANIFKSDLLMHRCYDLKGSLQGRKVEKMRYREKTLHKESDLDFLFYLEPLVRQRLLKQIKYDCAFLEAAGIMNYSLMLGLHVQGSRQVDCVNSKCSNNGMRIFNVALHQSDVASQRSSDSSYKDSTSKYSTTNIMDIISNTSFSENEASEVSFGDQWLQNNSCKFGEELAARGVRISKNGTGTLSCQNFTVIECYDVLLCFGIVDFFQNYNVIKRIEHAYKSLQFDRKMIAAVNPKIYSSRFQEFISDIFKADEPLN